MFSTQKLGSCSFFAGKKESSASNVMKTQTLKLGTVSVQVPYCKMPGHDRYFLYFKLNDHPLLVDKDINFLSIKAPLFSESKVMGLCGISLTVTHYNLNDFLDVITNISNLLQANWSKNKKLDLFDATKLRKPKLTQRELDCLSLYMKGNSTKNIANQFHLSIRTVEFYMENIKGKFGVTKRSELLPLAFTFYPELLM